MYFLIYKIFQISRIPGSDSFYMDGGLQLLLILVSLSCKYTAHCIYSRPVTA